MQRLRFVPLWLTSNVTGRHRGAKRKRTFVGTWRPQWVLLQHYYVAISCHPLRGAPLVFIIECGIARFLCAMRVLEVQASSSSHRLPLCQILFFFAASIAELAHGEKSRTHSPSFIDATGTEALALRNIQTRTQTDRQHLTSLYDRLSQLS